jgi:hypothetical protein
VCASQGDPSFLDGVKEAGPVLVTTATLAGAFVGVVTFISANANANLSAEVKVLSAQQLQSQSQMAELKNLSESHFVQLSSKLDSAVRLSGSVERIDKDLTVVLSRK